MVILWRRGVYARTNVSYCVGVAFTDLVAYVVPSVCIPSDSRKSMVLWENRVWKIRSEIRLLRIFK